MQCKPDGFPGRQHAQHRRGQEGAPPPPLRRRPRRDWGGGSRVRLSVGLARQVGLTTVLVEGSEPFEDADQVVRGRQPGSRRPRAALPCPWADVVMVPGGQVRSVTDLTKLMPQLWGQDSTKAPAAAEEVALSSSAA